MIHSLIGSLSGRCRLNWAQASSPHVSPGNKIDRKFPFYIILEDLGTMVRLLALWVTGSHPGKEIASPLVYSVIFFLYMLFCIFK